MIPDEVLVGAPKTINTAAGSLDPIDVKDAVVVDAPSTDDAITVSPVEAVPGSTSTNLVHELRASAAGEPEDTFMAAVGAADNSPAAADDLIVIEGIGPKISAILIGEGITTFAQLVDADVAQISTMLRNAGVTTANPTTWPQQAQLARDGQWDALKELQGRIKNGRLES
jgi:predicted flap endonuclease-1-like 5' DNA nuclease